MATMLLIGCASQSASVHAQLFQCFTQHTHLSPVAAKVHPQQLAVSAVTASNQGEAPPSLHPKPSPCLCNAPVQLMRRVSGPGCPDCLKL